MTTEELNRLYATLRDFRIQHTETDSEESRAIFDAMNVVADASHSKDKTPVTFDRAVRVAALNQAVELYARGPHGEVYVDGMTDLVMRAASVFADWIQGESR